MTRPPAPSTVGSTVGYRRARSRIGGIDGPLLAVLVIAVIAATWVGALLWRRLDGLATAAYDLGFFQQVLWDIRTNGSWTSSFHEGSFLGLHFSPILAVLAHAQGLANGAVHVLVVIHALGIGALVPATFLFLRAALRPSPWASVVAATIAAGIPIWAATQWVIRSDFHPELLGVVLALLCGWAGLSGRPWAMWLLAAVALTTREDVAYAVAVMGLVVVARGSTRMRRHGAAMVVVAVLAAVLILGVVMPWFRDGLPSDTARYYRWLGDGPEILTAPLRLTDRVVAALVRPAPWLIFGGMLAAVAGLPLLRPRWLLPIVPPLLAVLLSGHPPQAALIFQYPLLLMTPLLAATAMGGRRALAIGGRARRRWRLWRRTRRSQPQAGVGPRRRDGPLAVAIPVMIVVVLLTPVLVLARVQGSIPPFVATEPTFLERPAAAGALQAIARTVPLDAALAADEGLVPLLAARPDIRRLTAARVPDPTAYVIIDRMAWSPRQAVAHRERILAVLPDSGRPVVADDGRFIVWGPRPVAATP